MATVERKVIIVGAGIAGVSAAYQLAVVHGIKDVVIVEAENPLSMTSDKSTEAYRNWWPGPDVAMTAYMNRSIDILEDIARKTGNRINMNRRGYLFASADTAKAPWLIEMARLAAKRGGGAARVHDTSTSSYDPSPDAAFDEPLTGADIITDRSLIARHYPYLAPDTCVVAHARRAGWLSAQQLGMTMLEAARDAGARQVRGRVVGVDSRGRHAHIVRVETANGLQSLEATDVVLAAGPGTKALTSALGLELPIFAERHLKISFSDILGIVPRTAPMIIWLDEQQLPWSEDERAMLVDDDATRWLTETFPWGVHGRPDGAGANGTFIALYNYESHETEVVFPLPEHEHYGEITMRGLVTMIPGLQAYVDKGVRPYIDGGYYIKTRENRPLVGPTAIDGVFLAAAFGGFGIMASCAGGDLVARHVLGLPLPDYAPSFMLSRYRDPSYQALLDRWGDGGQL